MINILCDVLQTGAFSVLGAATVHFLGRSVQPIIGELDELTEPEQTTPIMHAAYTTARVASRLGGWFCPTQEGGNALPSLVGVGLGGIAACATGIAALPAAAVTVVGISLLSPTSSFQGAVGQVGDLGAYACQTATSKGRELLSRGVRKETFEKVVYDCERELCDLPAVEVYEEALSLQHLQEVQRVSDEHLQRIATLRGKSTAIQLLHRFMLTSVPRDVRFEERIQRGEENLQGGLCAAYLTQFEGRLAWWQALLARFWFYCVEDAVTVFTQTFFTNVLHRAREVFFGKEALLHLVDAYLSLNGPLEGGGTIEQGCQELIDAVTDSCMPPVHYFYRYHNTFLSGIFRSIDGWIERSLHSSVAERLKEAISEGLVELIEEELTPEKMQKKIIRGMAVLTESVSRGEDLEAPLPYTQDFARMRERVLECLQVVQDRLALGEILPILNVRKVKEKNSEFITRELLSVITFYGERVEMEQILLNFLREFFQEEEERPLPSWEESVNSLFEAVLRNFLIGDPAHVHVLFRGAGLKQYGLLKGDLDRLKEIRTRMIMNPQDTVELLRKETGILRKMSEEARSFSSRMESLPSSHQETLRGSFFPIYQNVYKQIVQHAILQKQWEEKKEKQSKYEAIKTLMDRSDRDFQVPPEGVTLFCRSLEEATEGLLRRDGALEWTVRETIANFRVIPLEQKLQLKDSLLCIVRERELEDQKERIKAEGAKEELFVEARRLLAKLYVALDEEKKLKVDVKAQRESSLLFSFVRSYMPSVVLTEEQQRMVQDRIRLMIFSQEHHTMLMSRLLRVAAARFAEN